MQTTFKVLKFILDVSTGILMLTQSGGYADMVPNGGCMIHQIGWRVLPFSKCATLFFSKIWGGVCHTKNENPEGIKHSCVDVTGERIGGPTIMRVNKMRAKKGKDHKDKFRQKNGLPSSSRGGTRGENRWPTIMRTQ